MDPLDKLTPMTFDATLSGLARLLALVHQRRLELFGVYIHLFAPDNPPHTLILYTPNNSRGTTITSPHHLPSTYLLFPVLSITSALILDLLPPNSTIFLPGSRKWLLASLRATPTLPRPETSPWQTRKLVQRVRMIRTMMYTLRYANISALALALCAVDLHLIYLLRNRSRSHLLTYIYRRTL
jgi:hypothetical protein